MPSNIPTETNTLPHNNQSIHDTLLSTFGFHEFRQGQQQTIQQLIAGQSTLSIFPTGSGKSLCYQLTALHLPNLTLVVSPLLALMKDQLTFLQAKGIAAASLDSSLSHDENQTVMRNVREGRTKILMVSVERFKNERFRNFISAVAISMLVVDEAHCISEWGHNFRPDYLKLPSYREQLNIERVLLLTATATKKVKLDMASKFAIDPACIVQTGFYRPNLDLTILPVSGQHKDDALLHTIKQQQGAGIVYVTLQQSAEQVAQFLTRNNINASAYHAGFESDKRQQIQQDFMAGNIQIVVATIAFGMGIDKSDIRFVIHYDLPKSIENYSQEIGRAGRDGQASFCTTLANLDGMNTVENFVYGDTPELSAIEYLINTIRSESQNSQWECQLLSLSNDSNIRQLPLKTLLVQLELHKVIEPTFSYFAEFKYKFTTPKEEVLNLFQGERQEFIGRIFDHTQFKKIWGELNFDSLYNQYQYERGRVITALEYLQEKNHITLESKRMTDVYRINDGPLQQANLAQTLFDYFVDKEQKEIKRIGALVRFFELDKCLSNMLSRYFDDQASPDQCGHCSVCRGQVAKLSYSQQPSWPDDAQIQSAIQELSSRLAGNNLTIDTYCRFLSGMSTPLFTKAKVRQLKGFALLEQIRYQDIKDKVLSMSAI